MLVNRHRPDPAGFTLMEIVIVLAVIGTLLAVLTPLSFRYIDDARKAQAQHDVTLIATAIHYMYKDTGRWPFYATGTSSSLRKGTSDFDILTSNPTVTAGATLSNDETAPAPASAFITGWTTTLKVDSLTHQLVMNTPGYPVWPGVNDPVYEGDPAFTRSSQAPGWRGPYLTGVPTTDPWGKSYLVNIGHADPATETVLAQRWVIVISAGPNGVLDTDADTLATANPPTGDLTAGAAPPGGDDLMARVK